MHGSIQRFLHDLGRHLDDPGARPPTGHLQRFDRAPVFVHALQALDGEAGAVRGRLMGDLPDLAEQSITTAVTDAHEPLLAGRFRAPASPAVQTRPAQTGEPADAWVAWHGNEEATGWPQLDLALLIDAGPGGTRLAILPTREPGYDLSVPASTSTHVTRSCDPPGPPSPQQPATTSPPAPLATHRTAGPTSSPPAPEAAW